MLCQLGPCAYQVVVDNCLVWKRHVDQLRSLREEISHLPISALGHILQLPVLPFPAQEGMSEEEAAISETVRLKEKK